MKFFSSRNAWIFFLVAIVLVGFTLRAYHFSSWLHFEIDQARDAWVIDDALVGGPGELTLLGPKAGGTFLRLAPGFYYLQYLSGLLFGGTPSGIAMIVMLLSVASVPVFYFLVRRYFVATISLLLTLLFATSAFFVMYGRFAWNPNILPFFILFGMYALLRSVDPRESRPGRWFLAAAFSLTLATHGHFLAFLAVPTITTLFLLFKRPRFSLRAWAAAIALVGALYLPMVLNEWKTGGANTREFFGAITEKSTKEDHILIEKFIRNASEHALGALVIVAGSEKGTFPAIVFKDGHFSRTCAEKCDAGKWYGVTAALLLAASVVLLVFFWWREEKGKKKDFLLLCGIWLGVSFVLFTPLSYGFAPRFFLVSGMLFFILLGFLLVFMKRLLGDGRIGLLVAVSSALFLVGSNLSLLSDRFSELSQADTVAIDSPPDRILKERIRVTLEQQEEIVSMFEARYRENAFPIYMWSEPQYRRALKYLMEKRGIENAVLGYDGVYRQGTYFLVLRAQSDLEDALKKYRSSYDVGETVSFGTLVALELFPKEEAIKGERQDFSAPSPSDSTAPPRYTWNEFFGWSVDDASSDQEGALEQSEDRQTDN